MPFNELPSDKRCDSSLCGSTSHIIKNDLAYNVRCYMCLNKLDALERKTGTDLLHIPVASSVRIAVVVSRNRESTYGCSLS